MLNTLNRVKQHTKEVVKSYPYHTYAFTALYGSQNYGLSTPSSDVDTKTFILPEPRTLLLGQQVSTDRNYSLLDREVVGVKDLRKLLGCFINPSLSFLELLYTPYVDINPQFQKFYEALKDNKEDIVNMNSKTLLKAATGGAYSFLKRLSKSKFTDNKAYVNLVFYNQFVEKYLNFESFEDCLKCRNAEELVVIKMSETPVQNLEKLAETEEKRLAALDTRVEASPAVVEKAVKEWLYDLFNDTLKAYLFSDGFKFYSPYGG